MNQTIAPRIRVVMFEADNCDRATIDRLMELVKGGGGAVSVTTSPAVAERRIACPSPARPAPTVTPRAGAPKRFLVCEDFPRRKFTFAEARELCKVRPSRQITKYITHGLALNGMHVFAYAPDDAPDPVAAAAVDTVASDGEGAAEDGGDDGEEGDDDDDPPEAWAEGRLWMGLKSTEDERRRQRIRNALITMFLHVAHYHAERLHKRLPPEVCLDDLKSAAVFGLMDAIKVFDPLRGVKFATFAAIRVNGAINDHLREMDWAPRLVRARHKKLDAATTALRNELGREPFKEEVSGKLGLCEHAAEKLIRDGMVTGTVSLSRKWFETDSNKDVCEVDVLEDGSAARPLDTAETEDHWEWITRGLDAAEKTIIVLYYRHDMTMKEIGRVLDLSESRVSQMHSSLIERLRAKLTPALGDGGDN